jgi:hypothetical protein
MKAITAETVVETFIADTLFQTGTVNHPSQQVKLNKEVFSQREPVKLDIRLPEEISKAMVSVSVRKVAPVTFLKPGSRICQHKSIPVITYPTFGFIVENIYDGTMHPPKMVFLLVKIA